MKKNRQEERERERQGEKACVFTLEINVFINDIKQVWHVSVSDLYDMIC